jgi:hypothetical protein
MVGILFPLPGLSEYKCKEILFIGKTGVATKGHEGTKLNKETLVLWGELVLAKPLTIQLSIPAMHKYLQLLALNCFFCTPARFC